MPTQIQSTPTLSGESTRRFLANMKYVDEKVARKKAIYKGEEFTDTFKVLEFDNFEDWYEQYYRNTLEIKSDDYNFDEEYY